MTRTSILVVQQQPELQRALQANLRAGSYDVMAAGTGREAMALAARRPPDAVILDLSLPDVTGVEVITELRHRYRRRSSCCPAGPGPATRSARSTPAPTTTSPSRS
jgi:DNA-binding response OmpR family regulator